MRSVTPLEVNIPKAVPGHILAEFPEYPSAIVQLLYTRGFYVQEDVDRFLTPEYHRLHDPYLFKDMQRAIDRLYDAIEKNELIAIHGDYDADGVSGSVILESVLGVLGARTTVFLPHREKDGYGMNIRTVEYLHSQKAGLIITCDCGISNAAEIARASELGIDVIVTDHHQIPEILPKAFAIIHPKLKSETYPFKFLAGGGVAFKVAQGLLKSDRCPLSERDREIQEKWLLDLAAISSVADMVELIGENRILVTYGLLVLKKNRRLGMQALLKAAHIEAQSIRAESISYQIAPRINAAGRMDHANTAYMLLKADDSADAMRLAGLLESQNKERQAVTERMFRQAKDQAQDEGHAAVILFNREWTAGLTGLLAGKLVREFGKPVFAIGFDGKRLVGSGRSPAGISVMEGIETVKRHFISFGGHPQACGFRYDESEHDAITKGIHAFYDRVLKDVQPAPLYSADCEINFSDITWDLVDILNRFEPFGQANPEPVFLTRSVEVVDAQYVGKSLNHLKLALRHAGKKIDAIGFCMPGIRLSSGDSIDALYTISVNEWNGNRDIQVKIVTLAVHDR